MLLELKGVKKHFLVPGGFMGPSKSWVRAVNGVDLAVGEGEHLGLVGESGSGKSTLARLILKLMKADAGSIAFDGEDITHFSQWKFRKHRKNIQMVFQDPFNSLDPRFNIRHILSEAFILDKKRFHTAVDREEQILKMMAAVNLHEDILNRYPHEFSGGERQRIAIARSLMMNPKMLILDEALSSLDVLIQEQLIGLLIELQKKFNLTFLFISHNLKVVRKLSKKIAVMYKGKIVEWGSNEQVFLNPLHPYTKELLAAAIDYKYIKRDKEIEISDTSRLVDRGEGHVVLEN